MTRAVNLNPDVVSYVNLYTSENILGSSDSPKKKKDREV